MPWVKPENRGRCEHCGEWIYLFKFNDGVGVWTHFKDGLRDCDNGRTVASLRKLPPFWKKSTG